MEGLKAVNEIFNDSYQVFKKFYLSKRTDDDFTQVAIDAQKVKEKHKSELANRVLVATIEEIHRIGTMKN